ncbi:MAG: helix-hairpin-helix domain-containing protein [Bacteroidales bacterium]
MKACRKWKPEAFPKTVFTLFTFLLFHLNSNGQEQPKDIKTDEIDITDKIETISESTDAVLDYTDLISDLKYFREHPLNLNYATEEDLRKLVFLNVQQIFNLLAYRETYGNMVTLYELQSIEGYNRETIDKLLPYVYVSQEKPKIPLNLKGLGKYGNHEIILRYQRVLQEQKGYSSIPDSVLYANPNSRYMGSADKVYLRYGFNYSNKIRWGIVAEKDAGEVF